MNDHADELERIQRWLLEAGEGTADPEETRRINALLQTHAELRAAVARRLLDESLLAEELRVASTESLFHGQTVLPWDSPEDSAAVDVQAMRKPLHSAWKWIGGAAAGAAALAACLVLFLGRGGPGPAIIAMEEEPVAAFDTDAVAVLTRAVDVVWTKEDSAFGVNERISAGAVAISSGLLQLEFFSGATVVLEGPAELEVLSPMQCRCLFGKIRALVPPQASGFTIGGGGVDVIDHGTEFAMRVEKGGAGEVHVLDGEVALRPEHAAEERRLKHGQAVRFSDAGEMTLTAVDLLSFVGCRELQSLDDVHRAARYETWLASSRRWAKDPGMAAYFNFEGHAPSDRVLRSAVDAAPSSSAGAVVGCRWREGRFAGKGALEFKPTSDRVRVRIDETFTSCTLTAWVRIDGFDAWYSSLLMADGYEPASAHWQLTQEGRLKLSISGGGSFASPPFLKPQDFGRWIHLATVYDLGGRAVLHYANGVLIARNEIESPAAFTFGNAEIGNWSSLRKGKHPIRSLNGLIDELAVFRRPLAPGEIQAAYQAGRVHP